MKIVKSNRQTGDNVKPTELAACRQDSHRTRGDTSNIIPFPVTRVSPRQQAGKRCRTLSLQLRRALKKARHAVRSLLKKSPPVNSAPTRKAA